MQVTPADARKIRDSTLPQGYQGVPELAVYVTQPNPVNIARRESDGLLNVGIGMVWFGFALIVLYLLMKC